jgi:protein-S-isoprenylcysteine O-methyltransferase Ste14
VSKQQDEKKWQVPRLRAGAFFLLWSASLWPGHTCAHAGFEKPAWALIFSMILAPPSVALAWSATRHLGKQWRYKAALREGHELIQSGPYAHVRHPIYLSMLGMLVATLAAWTWWPMAIGSLIAFMAGTEIRIRAEERLLGSHFGAAYVEYKRRSKAYIPFVR